MVYQLEQQADIDTELRTTGGERHFAPEDELLIYRIVQEALRNVWKHSGAGRAEVAIDFGRDKTTIRVSDDGEGFEIEEDPAFVQARKIGLAGMQERADLLGGSLTIQSRPGQGTEVILEIPDE